MGGAMLSMLLGSMSMTITSTAMPSIITDLGGFSQYTWVFTAYIITETISLPLTGKLSDMYGRKWFLVSGMSIFVLGSFFSGLSQSMTQLIISRGLQGIGFGIGPAVHDQALGDQFGRLSTAAGGLDLTLDAHRAAGGQVFDFRLVVGQILLGDDLQITEARPVVQFQEGKPPLGVPPSAYPAPHARGLADRAFLAGVFDAKCFHRRRSLATPGGI